MPGWMQGVEKPAISVDAGGGGPYNCALFRVGRGLRHGLQSKLDLESTMYAVIKTGGKQYKVAPGETLKVESLDAEVGKTVSFDDVLMIVDGDQHKVGAPKVDGGARRCASSSTAAASTITRSRATGRTSRK
jgi:ribosomal protein L21